MEIIFCFRIDEDDDDHHHDVDLYSKLSKNENSCELRILCDMVDEDEKEVKCLKFHFVHKMKIS